MSNVLEVSNLTKIFTTRGGGPPAGGFTAVDGISFDVKEGEIVGLLGPNGAGKTTTIQMLLGLISSTSGTISYFGKPFPKEREYILSHINYASAYSQIQGKMTIRQNLRIYAGFYGIANPMPRINELLELFEITDCADKLFWHLSSGQRTRALLAKALLNKPRLILMDEPTASLDPEIIDKVLTLIEDMQRKERVSILFTSHHMEEVERICDRVIFLSHGKILTEDTPIGLTKRVGNATLSITFDGVQEPVRKFLEKESLTFSFPRKQVVEISVADEQIPPTLFGMSKVKIWMTNIEIKKPDLEDVFLSVAKQGSI